MIPFLIYVYLKKHIRESGLKRSIRSKKCLINIFLFLYVGTLILLLSLIPKLSKSQINQISYTIFKGRDNIGWLRLERNIDGNKSTLNLISEVKTRVIFLINVCTKETSTFEYGKLLHSSQFRKTNGSIKLNKQTIFTGEKYEVLKNGEKQSLGFSFIGTNLLSLYFQEPVGIDMLYCDNLECFIKIIKTNDGGYKVKFPDGNSNCYYYKDGICTKIKIEHTFYSAEIILRP